MDAAAVARWSAYAPLAVSGMRLVERSTTIALHGGAYDPRTFVSSSAAASVGPSATLPGGVRISADGLGDGAAAFWQVPLPARTLLRSVRATLVTARDATGDSLVGTWRGTSIDRVGWIQGSGGPQAFDIPTSRLPSTARAFALGVEQDGPGTLDVGTVTITVKYAVLQ